MLGIEDVDYSISEVFQNRTAAIKQVLHKMTFAEREEVNAKVANYKNIGLPEDMQRRSVVNFAFCFKATEKVVILFTTLAAPSAVPSIQFFIGIPRLPNVNLFPAPHSMKTLLLVNPHI
jgi:hypothetical protein